MGKYKANHNNINTEPIEEEKSEKEQKEESTEKALDAGLSIGLDAYTGGQFSKIKNGLSNIPGIGKAVDDNWNKTINKASKIAAKTPVGDLAHGLNESGVTDTVKSGYDMYSGAKDGKVNSINKISSNKKNSSSNSFLTDNIMSFGFSKSLKIKIYISLGIIIFFMLMIVSIVSGKDFENLALTNNATMTEKGTYINKEDIEKRMIYVGDSSIEKIKSSTTNYNISFITDTNANYEWLINTANTNLENLLADKPNAIVIFSIGANDTANIDNYITYYNQLKTKYQGIKLYIISLIGENENQENVSFNEKIKNTYTDNYIDISNIESSQLHNNILSTIRKSMGGDLIQKLEEVANWYIENIATYNQSLKVSSPFTTSQVRADCTGFAVAYMSYVSGVDIPISYSGAMVHVNGSWAKEVSNNGWIAYSADDIDTLQPGDVLVADSSIVYSKGDHAEIYVSETETFGWGSKKTKYPTNSTIQKSIKQGHIIFSDLVGTKYQHDYVTIYRYNG